MKYLLPVIGFVSCFTLQAQKNNTSKKHGQLFIGFNFSPDYDSRLLVNDHGDNFADQLIRSRNEREIGKMGYTTGLNFCISLTNLVGFEAGIQYSAKGYQTSKYDLVYQTPDP